MLAEVEPHISRNTSRVCDAFPATFSAGAARAWLFAPAPRTGSPRRFATPPGASVPSGCGGLQAPAALLPLLCRRLGALAPDRGLPSRCAYGSRGGPGESWREQDAIAADELDRK